MGDTESCCNIKAISSEWNQNGKQKQKIEVYLKVLSRLRELNVPEIMAPGFEDDLWAHFYRLPTRYALDMNVERAQYVLMHKRLLHIARTPAASTGPAVEVRLVQVVCSASGVTCKSLHSNSQNKVSPQDSDIQGNMMRPMHEITISTNDKPKLLSQLTSLLSETGLDIQEAHAFSTLDGYSLDVFVVGGWAVEETEKLKHVLANKIQKLEKQSQLKENGSPPLAKLAEQEKIRMNFISRHVIFPTRENGVSTSEASWLRFEKKIASGPFSDLYKGTLCNQDLAIKVLKQESLDENIHREFSQEVYILSKIQHRNVVKFVGACTKPPNLCLVTEYLSGGSMYDLLHKQKTVLALPSLLKVAIDVSEGMKYLHQNDIIHRDLKSANLLIDKTGVVKVADFGVARVRNRSGIMTAETGTYRWMAPEVIEHKPYDHKADVFSFAIVLWELLTRKLPYEHLSPLQAAVGVVQKGLRPKIPRHCHPKLVELLQWCWQQDPSLRPSFSEILEFLLHISKMVCQAVPDEMMNVI
ncbi:serine/threonine-protein kinase STY46 [Medicago truncatula]|uniref:serine/threonine-protein kinase STY46 n=1 Tax=Medicago truncatula TaxID=3880 RepID=UPI001967819D|nr:serine/threonine-protein kinase STY46 [Medicago truncatula]